MTFSHQHIPSIAKHLNRQPKWRDVQKICLDCNAGFNKSRPKAAKIFTMGGNGQPVESGRHVCQHCADKRLAAINKAA